MRYILILISMGFGSIAHGAEASTKHRLASWNVLCATCNAAPPVPAWEVRRDAVIEKIANGGASIIALQEVQAGDQLSYIQENLSEYSSTCVSKIDNSGAHTLFLVKIGIDYECLPPIDIADNRQCLHIVASGVNYYNCHFPLTDVLNTASTDIFLSSIEAPFVFMGDYNTWPGETGYSHNDARLSEYTQTRGDIDGLNSFWNIDKVGTSSTNVEVSFNRTHDMTLSDHPYVRVKFYELSTIAVINMLLVTETL